MYSLLCIPFAKQKRGSYLPSARLSEPSASAFGSHHQVSQKFRSPSEESIQSTRSKPCRSWNFSWRRKKSQNRKGSDECNLCSDSLSTLVHSITEKQSISEPSIEHYASACTKNDSTEKLNKLRALMREHSLDYYLVPSEDAHNGEYIADSDQRRRFISGFTGSAGIAIITLASGLSGAFLSTDSRFWIQAAEELDENWTVVQSGYDWTQFLVDHVTDGPKGTQIGVDPTLITYANAVSIRSRIAPHGCSLIFPEQNLVDLIWVNDDKPNKPRDPVFIHDLKYSGEPASSKLTRLRSIIFSQLETDLGLAKSDTKATATLISHLPSIAWLLNLRGTGIPYNPLFHAYLYVSLENEMIIFLDSSQAPLHIMEYLRSLGVKRKEYDEVWEFLRSSGSKEHGKQKIIITPKSSYALSLAIGSENNLVLPSFTEPMLSVKNSTELASLRTAYLKDGLAFTQFLTSLSSTLACSSPSPLTEFSAAELLTQFRISQSKGTYRDQKEPISASGPNAALPHYVAKKGTAKIIDGNMPYLNDSGGQYLEGTCDTTRTVYFGEVEPDEDMCVAYTRVLQGHIAISTAIFPAGTSGRQLDVLARRPLWKDGLNYGHGTGHGFGTFLTVHEGVQSFSSDVPLVPGHVLTIEPGCYNQGKWGVRIESALAVTNANTTHGEVDGWLRFERLTIVPINTPMIKWELLTKSEKIWLKEHNQECYNLLSPHLKDDIRALSWLKREAELANRA